MTTSADQQCVYCGVSYSHSLDCKRKMLFDALRTIANEKLFKELPEDEQIDSGTIPCPHCDGKIMFARDILAKFGEPR